MRKTTRGRRGGRNIRKGKGKGRAEADHSSARRQSPRPISREEQPTKRRALQRRPSAESEGIPGRWRDTSRPKLERRISASPSRERETSEPPQAPEWIPRGRRAPGVPPPPNYPPPTEEELSEYSYYSASPERRQEIVIPKREKRSPSREAVVKKEEVKKEVPVNNNPYVEGEEQDRPAPPPDLVSENLPAHLKERQKRIDQVQQQAKEAKEVYDLLSEEAEVAATVAAKVQAKAEEAKIHYEIAQEEADLLDKHFLEALRKEQQQKAIRADLQIEKHKAARLQEEFRLQAEQRGQAKREAAQVRRREASAASVSASGRSLVPRRKPESPQQQGQRSYSSGARRQPSTRASASAGEDFSDFDPESERSSRTFTECPVVLSLDWNDTLAVPDPDSHRGKSLYVPYSHNEVCEKALAAGIQLQVLSFVVQRLDETRKAVRNWRLYPKIRSFQNCNQRSGYPFWRDHRDTDNPGGGYTSGGKDKLLAEAGIVLHIDDDEEVCSACERQGIFTCRIRTHKNEHPKREQEDTSHWEYNLGVFDDFVEAVETVIYQVKLQRKTFALTTPFWDRHRWVKYPHRYTNRD